MGYYVLEDDEHLAFPEELRNEVIKARQKSRSKHKAHPEDEYVWAVYYCEYFSGGGGSIAFPSLTQAWKFREQSNWSAPIEGPHRKKPRGWDKETDYWKNIKECIEAFGLKFDKNRLSPWIMQNFA